MNRKDFIINGCAACLSATAVSSLFASCTATKYISGNLGKDGLIVSKDEFKIKQKQNTAYRSFIIIRNDALQYPVCVYRFSDQEYSALWMQCTHQGAELNASGDFLQCPAHGSEFSNKGKVMNGPADNGLRSFPVAVTNNELFIDLRKQS
jgi:Rieske Fe-S protein